MRITPETNSFEANVLENKKLPSIFAVKRKDTGIFSAITLSLILAACGGGGGGGGYDNAVSPTPGTDTGGTDSGGTDSGGTDSSDTSIQLDGGAYSATSAADVFSFDVSFDGTSIVGLDNNVSITGFDPASDSIVLRGSGGSDGLTSSTLLSSSGVDVVSSAIDNNTVIYFSPNSSGSSSSITLEGVVDSDLSTITISAADGAANDASASPITGELDLSEGTANASDDAEAFVYEIKFVDGVPVAIDSDVTIKGFDVDNDTLTLQAASVPSGFAKSSLLSTDGVDVVSSTIDNKTTIYFAPDSSGKSGSITLDGIVDADLSSITISILSGSVDSGGTDLSSGSNIELGTDNLTAQTDAENFVFDATYSSTDTTISGSDGPVTITGFDQSNDKIVILASAMPVGYDLSDFKIASGIDIVASTIDDNTTIYFAPNADGESTSITLAGIVDADLSNTSIVFTSSLTGATSSGTTTSTDTSASSDAATSDDSSTTDDTATTDDSSTTDDTATTDDSSTTDDTSTTDDSSTTDSATLTVVEISADAETTITATDAAEEFRYEFAGSTSSEGNFIVTIDGFDSSNDKIVLVNVGGDNLTTEEFKALSGVEISGNSFDNQTRILFGADSTGGSGELAINGIYDSDLTTITLEILSDTNLSASTSGDLG